MLKKIDNSFSVSIPELKSQMQNILNEMDVDKELEKNINLIKSYLIDAKLIDEWSKTIFEKFHLSIPNEIKTNCKICKGNSDLPEDMVCANQYEIANDEFLELMMIHVLVIENNKHLFKSQDLILSLTTTFFENFEFIEGKLIFNFDKYDNIILTNILLLLREHFSEIETRIAIKEINQAIEELEFHKVIATSTNRVLFDLVKPQLKFLKKQLKYYEKKLLTEPSTNNSPTIEKKSLFKLNNNLIPKLSIEQVYNYFKILTLATNRNQEFYLTEKKLLVFIQSTFVDKTPIKQSFDVLFSRDKIDVRSVFRNFLSECSKFENNNKNLKQKYFNIMDNGFEGFNKIDFDKFHKTNNKITTIKLHKSK